MATICLLGDLPEEVLLVVAKSLAPRDVIACSCSSRRFLVVFLDRSIWKELFLRRWTRGSAEAGRTDIPYVVSNFTSSERNRTTCHFYF